MKTSTAVQRIPSKAGEFDSVDFEVLLTGVDENPVITIPNKVQKVVGHRAETNF